MNKHTYFLYSFRLTFRFVIMLVLLAGAGFAELGFTSSVQAAPTHGSLPQSESEYGEVIVGLRDAEVRASSLLAGLSSAAGVTIHAAEAINTRGIISCDNSATSGLRLTVAAGSEETVAEALRQQPEVLFAVPNWPVYAADRMIDREAARASNVDALAGRILTQDDDPIFEINDPFYVDQAWYMDQLNLKGALAQMAAQEDDNNNRPIQVAIIDSGIDTNHPEFTGRLLQGYNYLSPDELPEDDYGHGTHVAGLIGASVNNGLGIAGVAPNVIIAPYKTLDRNGSGTIANVVQAICRAVDDGADIINLSLTSPSQNTDEYTAAFDYARDHGVMMIAAAGNSSQTRNMWPARLPDVMGVASTNINGTRASYSSPGDDLDLAAPGGEFSDPILSTWPDPDEVICNTTDTSIYDAQGGGYCNSIGTSMSAALVSGVAALLKELNPEATPTDIREMLKQTAQPLAEGVDEVGAGLLDANAAILGAMRSELLVTPLVDNRVIPLSSPPFTVAIELENSSFEALDWRLTISPQPWVSFSALRGSIRLGTRTTISVTVTPTELPAGFYRTPVTFFGTRSNGTLLFQTVQIDFTVEAEPSPVGLLYITSPHSQSLTLSAHSTPYSTTISFVNLGAETITWSIEPDATTPWIQVSSAEGGSIAYLEPMSSTLTIDPRMAQSGQSITMVTLRGERADGSESIQRVELNLEVIPPVLLPLIFGAAPAEE